MTTRGGKTSHLHKKMQNNDKGTNKVYEKLEKPL